MTMPYYPQMMPGQQAQQFYPGNGMPQQMPMGMPQQMPGVVMPQVAPGTVYMPDAAQVQAAYDYAAQQALKMGQARNNRFFKMPGPQGETKWGASIPVGYEHSVRVWIGWGYKSGELHFKPSASHFFRSQAHPKGFSVLCPGQGCLICQLRENLNNYPIDMHKRIQDATRTRTKYLYNIFLLDNIQSHLVEGKMVAWILEAGAQLHGAIGKIIGMHKLAGLIDPDHGRPVYITKKKTGTQDMDVEWSIMPYDASPLPPEFRQITLNDLGATVILPTLQDQQMAVQEILTGNRGGANAAYQPMPAPPYGTPYQQSLPPAPITAMPSAPQMPMMPASAAYTGQAMYAPSPTVIQPVQTVQAPNMPSMPPGQYNPPMPPAPPPLSAPAVRAPVTQTMYSPVPSGAPMQQAPMPNIPAAGGPQQLTLPLQAGITLAGGRERCFGKHSEGDYYCRDCPEWIKMQCIPVSPRAQISANTPNSELIKLQQAIAGK